MECNHQGIKLNLGSGRIRFKDFINIDLVQIVDGNGDTTVDILRDIEKEGIPFCDNSVDEIVVDNVLEHVSQLRVFMNECWRVLKVGGTIRGMVPIAGSEKANQDPTHVRLFTKGTFGYLCGVNLVVEGRPSHPKYADYGFYAWELVDPLSTENEMIIFKMSPNKKKGL